MDSWEIFGILMFIVAILILIYAIVKANSGKIDTGFVPPITPVGPVVDTLEFIVLSDIHLDSKKRCNLSDPTSSECMVVNPDGPNFRNDMDSSHMNLFLKDIQDNIADKPNIKFIVVTGDSGGHTSSDETRKEDISDVLKALYDTFKLPILYAFGNNDSAVRDYGPYTTENVTLATGAGWENSFFSMGTKCVGSSLFPCILNINQEDNTGYYSAYLGDHLRLITLNSVQFSKDRSADHTGADKQLSWFYDQMEEAANNKEYVLLAMHIPPDGNWQDHYLKDFLDILNKHPSILIGALVGHTHLENIQAISLDDGKYLIPIIYTAAQSTAHGNAPSFKHHTLGTLADGTWLMQDFTTFSYQQPSSSDKIELVTYYSFDDTYCQGDENTNIMKCMSDNLASKTSFKSSFMDGVNLRLTVGNTNYSEKQRGEWIISL